MIEVSHLAFSYNKNQGKVLEDISFRIPQGKITTVMGANGCGKSTLFQLMVKNLMPDKGTIYYQEKEIHKMRQKEFARAAAIVHQNNTVLSEITVEQLVAYGRTPHLPVLGTLRKEDHKIIDWAIEVMEIEKYRDRRMMDLSGGQRQRVWIAMALAQKTELLFLDEPTTYLDIRYQIELLNKIRWLNREFGITVVMVLHDINHAVYYSDYIIGLKDGHIAVEGEPEQVITPETIEVIYGIRLEMVQAAGKRIVLNVQSRDTDGRN